MKALFAVPTSHEVSLPPMDKLQWVDEFGVLHGGWWIAGHTPQGETTLIVVETTEEMINEMADNPDYLFLEDIEDVTTAQ